MGFGSDDRAELSTAEDSLCKPGAVSRFRGVAGNHHLFTTIMAHISINDGISICLRTQGYTWKDIEVFVSTRRATPNTDTLSSAFLSFTDDWWMKLGSKYSSITPAADLEVKFILLRKDNRSPVLRRSVDMLIRSSKMFPSMP